MARTPSIVLPIVLGVCVMAAYPARAEDCNTPPRSTAAHADCEYRNLERAMADTEASLLKALAAAQMLVGEHYTRYDFGPEIRASQVAWAAWVEKECELEANAIMGSAGAYELLACKRRMTVERAKRLGALGEKLQP